MRRAIINLIRFRRGREIFRFQKNPEKNERVKNRFTWYNKNFGEKIE